MGKYTLALAVSIILTIISLPLSYSDARPVDGYLMIGFPFTVYSIYSGFGCAGIPECTQPRISYVGIVLNILFFFVLTLLGQWIYYRARKGKKGK